MSFDKDLMNMPLILRLEKPQTEKKFVLQELGHFRKVLHEESEYVSKEEEYFNLFWSILIKKSKNPQNPSLRVFLRCRNTTGAPQQQMDVSLNFQFWGYSILRKELDLDVRFAGKGSVEDRGGKLCRWKDLKLTRKEYEETQTFPRIPDEQLKKEKLWGAIGKEQNKNKLPHAIRISVRIKETELLTDDFLKAVDLAKEHKFEVGSRTFFAPKMLHKNVRHARNEKKLKESVDPVDFQNLLRVVSSHTAEIDDNNVEGLLVVSSILNVRDIHEKCKRFIKDGSQKSLEKKFQLVLQYGWEALKSQCILRFESAEQMYNAIPSYLQTTQASAAQEDWEEKLKAHQRAPKGLKQEIKEEVDEDGPVPKKRRIDGRAGHDSKTSKSKIPMVPIKREAVSPPPPTNSRSLLVPKRECADDYENAGFTPTIKKAKYEVPSSRVKGKAGVDQSARGSGVAPRSRPQTNGHRKIVSEIESLNMSEEDIKRFAESSETAERLIACLDETSMEELDDETSKLSNDVLFNVLSTIVQRFNMQHPEDKVGLFGFEMATSEGVNIANQLLCNENGDCRRFILPVHTRRRGEGETYEKEHFALVYFEKGTPGHILYADSARFFHLPDEKIKRIARELGMPGVKVEKLGTNRIPLQILENSCGVHVAAICHVFLELGHYFPAIHVDAELLRQQMVTFTKKAHSVKKDYAVEIGVKTNWSRKRVNVTGGEAKENGSKEQVALNAQPQKRVFHPFNIEQILKPSENARGSQ
ncbi:hypothetical protein CAEBREN_20855 [Caenorhabditis brenneri]|uniref:Uncharacterized protein n=1 Tax=Caenorhabditis brenneri TaxID=135651 RepID=G0N7W8_CAEBE|nr:hypothetical protein CAEBREN_20855 [Caenorhabditis brenneri]